MGVYSKTCGAKETGGSRKRGKKTGKNSGATAGSKTITRNKNVKL